MSTIRKTNTKPELTVRRFLHARGFRYRLHVKGLPGSPDVVLASRRGEASFLDLFPSVTALTAWLSGQSKR